MGIMAGVYWLATNSLNFFSSYPELNNNEIKILGHYTTFICLILAIDLTCYIFRSGMLASYLKQRKKYTQKKSKLKSTIKRQELLCERLKFIHVLLSDAFVKQLSLLVDRYLPNPDDEVRICLPEELSSIFEHYKKSKRRLTFAQTKLKDQKMALHDLVNNHKPKIPDILFSLARKNIIYVPGVHDDLTPNNSNSAVTSNP